MRLKKSDLRSFLRRAFENSMKRSPWAIIPRVPASRDIAKSQGLLITTAIVIERKLKPYIIPEELMMLFPMYFTLLSSLMKPERKLTRAVLKALKKPIISRDAP